MNPGTVMYFIDKLHDDILILQENAKKISSTRKIETKIQLYSSIYRESSKLNNIILDFELALRNISTIQPEALEILVDYQNIILKYKDTSMDRIKELEI